MRGITACLVSLAEPGPTKRKRLNRVTTSENARDKKEEEPMKGKLAGLVVAAGLFLCGTAAWAHHAFTAEFDSTKPVKLQGTVTKMEWINPHAWIHVDVKGDDGKVTPWMIEAAAPNALLRRGWNKNSLPAGTEILVEGYQAKDGQNRANGSVITFTDGKKLFVGSSAGDPGAAPGAPPK